MRRRTFMWGAMVALLAVSCGTGPQPRGVNLRRLSTDVGLGADKGEPGGLANTLPEPVAARSPAPPPEIKRQAPDLFKPRPQVTCTEPNPLRDFPEVPAPTKVDPKTQPKSGIYLWKVKGFAKDQRGNPVKFDELDLRFVSVQSNAIVSGAYDISVFQIEYSARGGTAVTTTYLVVPSSPAAQGGAQSDIGAGVYISAIDRRNFDGSGSQFRPQPPVQLVAFPLQVGQQINSTGVDPDNGQSLSIVGEVKPNKHVAACGKFIDSWFVDATSTFRVPAGNPTGDKPQPPGPPIENYRPATPNPSPAPPQVVESNYDYGIATQYGGLVVFEHIDTPPQDPVRSFDMSIGTVEPLTEG